MNKEQAKELWPIIKAYAEGKEVQVKNKDGGSYMYIDSPSFNPEYNYRIKPKDEYVPFTYEDTLVGEIILSKPEHKLLIASQDHNGVYVIWDGGISCLTYKTLLDCHTFIDGTNCGKKVE
jgi:hypothetical protein